MESSITLAPQTAAHKKKKKKTFFFFFVFLYIFIFFEENFKLVTEQKPSCNWNGRLRYQGSATSYLEVLTTDSSLFTAQLTLVRSREEDGNNAQRSRSCLLNALERFLASSHHAQ